MIISKLIYRPVFLEKLWDIMKKYIRMNLHTQKYIGSRKDEGKDRGPCSSCNDMLPPKYFVHDSVTR